MFGSIVVMLQLCSLVYAQPLSCSEDVHCSEGHFCELETNVCRSCLQCEDFNRFVPIVMDEAMETCIKSVEACGPCFEGYVNIFESNMKGQCVSPELLQFNSNNAYCMYVWVTAAIIGLLVVVIFIYVIKNTSGFQIVPQYDPVSTICQLNDRATESTEASPSNNFAKRVLLLLFKNLKDQK